MEGRDLVKFSVFFAFAIVLAPVSIRAAAPDPITDLKCVYSGTLGSVRLTWTVPSGSPASYQMRYNLMNITEGNYLNATPYNQNWAGSANDVYATGLAQNTNWFFAMKAVGADGVSAISNIATCQANPVAGANAPTTPGSAISNLASGSEIPAGTDFTITGTSFDQGGSSVQKVEISFDDGATWRNAAAVKASVSGFDWSYKWASPAAGDYLIKTRATDWLGYQENPAAALSVKAAVQSSAAATTAATSTQTTVSTTTTAGTTTTSTTDQNQAQRNLLIQIIQILLQRLGLI
ncbi:MAG: hypothetical protein WC949_04475 [Candidatus Paceibacterota bacterium]